jgi:hypothetical protein
MVDINKIRDRLKRRRVKADEVGKAVAWARNNS